MCDGRDVYKDVILSRTSNQTSLDIVSVWMALIICPSSKEIDPNTVMAPFFIIFFGLMFSDGGYGLILSLLSGIVLWRFKLEENMRKFMKLIFFCGLSTMFWGLMFGGWFGISALAKYAVWVDMIGEPERIPSSLRMNALLELSQKLQRTDFASQFRDHAARDKIARNIGEERDIISGFAITASLIFFLSSNL